MSFKIVSILLLVGFLAIKTSNANPKGQPCNDGSTVLSILSSLAKSIANITGILAKGTGTCNSDKKCNCVKPPVDKCENLRDGRQYYLQSADGKFAVVDATKQLGFVKSIASNDASRFTATKLGCNLYGLCVDGFCMSRCESCKSDTGEVQTVKFHATNSNGAYSKWTFISAGSDGEYNLKIDGSFGYLNYKKTPSGDNQLSLSTQLSNETKFKFIEVNPSIVEKCDCVQPTAPVVDKCENLKDGAKYYLKSSDEKFAVVDATKQLGFVKSITSNDASRFTATKLGCNLYGLCVDGFCMSRCESCKSDTGEVQTVKFHATNSNGAYSKWTFISAGSDGEYNLKIDGSFGYLNYKKTPSGDNQLSLSTQLSNETKFKFIEV